MDELIINRAIGGSVGFSEFDAMHLACAESGAVQIFLTTDDRLIRRATRNADIVEQIRSTELAHQVKQ